MPRLGAGGVRRVNLSGLMTLNRQSLRVRNAPGAIWASSIVLLAQIILLLITGDLAYPFVQTVGALLLVGVLLSGSRFGWTLVLGAGAWDTVSRLSGQQPLWMLALDGVLLVTLLSPSARAWIWSARGQSRSGQPSLPSPSRTWASALIARASLVPFGRLAWRLGIGLAVLLVFSGMVELFKEGDGRGSSIVSVISAVTDITFSIVLCAFIVSLCAWGWSTYGLTARRRP